MNDKDKKEVMEMLKTVMMEKPDAKVEDLVNTLPQQTVEKIPEIIKNMSASELKKQFGLNVFDYKFVGIKDFITKNNIISGTKYPPTVNYQNKHLIISKIIKSLPAKQQKAKISHCVKVLKEKQTNPPKQLYGKIPSEKQLGHIKANLQTEIDRWE